MRRPTAAIAFLALLVGFAPVQSPAVAGGVEPQTNLGQLKQELYAYRRSGDYLRDFAAVAEEATRYLEGLETGGRLVLVLDIDETVLSNWPVMKSEDFGFVEARWDAWIEKGLAVPLVPMRELYDAARARGIAVVFLTGRREFLRSPTIENLRAAGFEGWEALILKPEDRLYKSAADFKAPQRCRLEKEGWTVVATIGDQESDLEGGCARRGFKLPNPFYYIP